MVPANIKDFEGFCYKILEKNTGMIYIGIKRFWKIVKYKPLKGRVNKRHKRVETSWKDYTTSSLLMQEKIALNPDNYDRIIIKLCKTKTEMKCWEAYHQLRYYTTGRWDKIYNEVINLRLRIRKGETNGK